MLHERSQNKKATNFMISFIWHSGKSKTIGTETDPWLIRAGNEGRLRTKGHRKHFVVMEKLSYVTVTELYSLKIFPELYTSIC